MQYSSISSHHNHSSHYPTVFCMKTNWMFESLKAATNNHKTREKSMAATFSAQSIDTTGGKIMRGHVLFVAPQLSG